MYITVYCLLSAVIGGVVGGLAGIGIADLLLRPEEAAVPVAGIYFGTPSGALLGLALPVFGFAKGASNRRT